MNTQDSRGHRHVTESVVHMLRQREFSDGYTRSFQKAAHVTEGMIKRLGPIHELQGHKGCVNCLEWSEDGRLLISGSDDTKVIIWDPMRRKQLSVIPTRHIGNIFSVKFLPRTNCSQIVTGAGDTFVTVMNVEHGVSKSSKATPLLHCRCHGGRVKRIATAPDLPDIFWSAGEDGLVLQFDLREPHTCPGSRSSDSDGSSGGGSSIESRSGRTVLIDLCRHAGWHAEAKCISVNAVKPHLIAVGANDSYARLYDRRMIKTSIFRSDRGVDFLDRQACLARVSVPDESVPLQSARYFTPGHLGSLNTSNVEENTPDRNFKLATTYVSFSPLGDELLVNLGGDHIYLYDINNTNNYTYKLTKPPKMTEDNGLISSGDTGSSGNNGIVLKTCCSTLNESFPSEEMSFDEVPGNLTIVPTSTPECSCQYIKRADSLMKRKWLGDYYAAARYYLIALNTRGGIRSIKGRRALIGIVYALIKLKWWKAAKAWMNLLRGHHSKYSSEYTRLTEALQKPNSECLVIPGGLQNDDQITIHKSQQETTWRSAAVDYQARFVGHCNTTTDIKEAAFIGPTGNYIAAGSDDGVLYIWKRDSCALVTAYHADTSIVNCVQPHPSTCLIATSGIETVVKLWQPLSDNDIENGKHVVSDIWQAAESNQQRIAMNPFETMIVNLGYERYRLLGPLAQLYF
ncbi:WD and tetratricopeptide repeats protein 1-like isoform X3 [Chrysoperla carnea]|uniref:WD and tetratricopeptide repeats protein 1-like isoform X3 n=1 Tax=Chrysoperla carnea TaxID=189513 RepID=UPI001D05CED3|nr:WD and tetratricopeptide repeats protein 1-like isoform X3 [Chrysoperla carnea]